MKQPVKPSYAIGKLVLAGTCFLIVLVVTLQPHYFGRFTTAAAVLLMMIGSVSAGTYIEQAVRNKHNPFKRYTYLAFRVLRWASILLLLIVLMYCSYWFITFQWLDCFGPECTGGP